MPEPVSRFHIYQLGQIHPLFLNLFLREEQWVTFAEASTAGTTVVDIYTTEGIQLPRSQTWYYLTREKALVMAVKRNDRIPFNFNTDDIYLRVYDNAYFASVRSDPLPDQVVVKGGVMRTMQDILDLQVEYQAKLGLPGGVYCFVNGYKVAAINLVTVHVEDVAEFVYDSSIIRVVDFKIDQLPTFDSDLDTKGKYLLHYAGPQGDVIDYLDDIDVFMVDIVTQKGVYVHKNAVDAVRMLTHRDYTVPVTYINAYFDQFVDPLTGTHNLANLYLRLHIRKSGYLRPLVFEHHRINELYKMPDADVRGAMLGIDSTVAVWRAPELEMSKYPLIMRSDCCDITNTMVKDAYGYNAIALLVANTPLKIDISDPSRRVPMPYLLKFDATVYEYDADGLLLDWYRHVSGSIYAAHSLDTRFVEVRAPQTSTIATVKRRYRSIRHSRIAFTLARLWQVFQQTCGLT